MNPTLPPDLVVGVSTSATQIEGATRADGRGPSIWDHFATRPGAIANGDTPEIACRHYERWREDVDLIADLGVDAYRLSISWPRVFPTGYEHRPNAVGLDFYDRLVDALLARDIAPWVTLYHWDLPQPVQDRGGWADRMSVHAFTRLAEAVARRLGDRVRHWNTINEPWCVAILGYETGQHAPGLTNRSLALAAAHHLLLAHGSAVPILRTHSPGARVGIVTNLVPAYPASPSAADADAADRLDAWFNRWFLDPLYGRGYPARIVAEERAAGRWPADADPTWLQEGDLDTIATPTDFLGINYYSRGILRGPEEGNLPRTLHEPPDDARTDMGWEVFPQGLTDLLVRLHQDYPAPSFAITECGAAYDTEPDADGVVRDTRRVAFLRDHLAAAVRARDLGVPVEAFFCWSLMDNFEWNEGYSKRFGLVWVDYATGQRTVKESGIWLRSLLRSRGRGAPPAAPGSREPTPR